MTQPAQSKPLFNEQTLIPQQVSNTTETFAEKISGINAEQIELIGMEIVFLIPPNLGPLGKAKVEQMVRQKQETELNKLSEADRMLMIIYRLSCEQAKLDFLPGETYVEFTTNIHCSVNTAIEEAFSTPLWFLQYGMSIQLSDHDPQDILWNICEEMNIDITSADIPKKYFIELNLDSKLSQEQSTLVFVITQKSNGIEFSRRTFTIEMLENALFV